MDHEDNVEMSFVTMGTPNAHDDEYDWYDDPPTAGQAVKEANNVDEIFSSLSDEKAKILELQNLFNCHPKSDFISTLVSRVSSDEVKLEDLRNLIFEEIRSLKEYPFPKKSELKRRICRGNGKSVSYKLASDIYSLANVIDGGSFDELKDIVNISRSSRSDLNSSIASTQKNDSNVDVLTSAVAQLQADVLKLKQTNISLSKTLTEEISAVKSCIKNVQRQSEESIQELRELIVVNAQSIDRITDDKSSGIAKLRSDIKLVRTELASSNEECGKIARTCQENVACFSRTAEKRLTRLEQRVKGMADNQSNNQAADNGKQVTFSEENRTNFARDTVNRDSFLTKDARDTPSQTDLGPNSTADCDAIDLTESCVETLYERPIGRNQPQKQLFLTRSAIGTRFVRGSEQLGSVDKPTYRDVLTNNENGQIPKHKQSMQSVSNANTRTMQTTLTVTSHNNVESPKRGSGTSDVMTAQAARTVPVSNNRCSYKRVSDTHLLNSSGAQTMQTNTTTINNSSGDSVTQGSATQVSRNSGGQSIPTIVSNRSNLEGGNSASGTRNEYDDFIKYVRKRTRRFYVGRVTEGITEDCIKQYIEGNNGPIVDRIDILTPRSGYDLYLRVSVEADNSSVLLEPDFWPNNITCRPWHSRESRFNRGRTSATNSFQQTSGSGGPRRLADYTR